MFQKTESIVSTRRSYREDNTLTRIDSLFKSATVDVATSCQFLKYQNCRSVSFVVVSFFISNLRFSPVLLSNMTFVK